MPVGGVLTKAHVGHDEKVGKRTLHAAHRSLDDAVLDPSTGTVLIFFVRNSEEENSTEAQLVSLTRVFHGLVNRSAKHSRHGSDLGTYAAPLLNEEGKEELPRDETRLANQGAKPLTSPEAAAAKARCVGPLDSDG
jgi:hypothetical protein